MCRWLQPRVQEMRSGIVTRAAGSPLPSIALPSAPPSEDLIVVRQAGTRGGDEKRYNIRTRSDSRRANHASLGRPVQCSPTKIDIRPMTAARQTRPLIAFPNLTTESQRRASRVHRNNASATVSPAAGPFPHSVNDSSIKESPPTAHVVTRSIKAKTAHEPIFHAKSLSVPPRISIHHLHHPILS
jgi:hypothetical protein